VIDFTGGAGIDQLTVICTSLQEKSKWLSALKPHVKAMNASTAVKPQHLQVVVVVVVVVVVAIVMTSVGFCQKKNCFCHSRGLTFNRIKPAKTWFNLRGTRKSSLP